MHHFATLIACALGLASSLASASPVGNPKYHNGGLKFQPTGYHSAGAPPSGTAPISSLIDIPLVTAAPEPTTGGGEGEDDEVPPVVTVTVDPNVKTLTEEVVDVATLTYTIGLGATARAATKTITKTALVFKTVVPIYESSANPSATPTAKAVVKPEIEDVDLETVIPAATAVGEVGCTAGTVTVTDVITATEFATVTVTAPSTIALTSTPPPASSSEVDSTTTQYVTITTRV